MAEATGLRNNALPYPIYGAPFGITFPLLDADGDPVSPSSADSEISKNGDTFADCTNEATEIATSSGICYLLLTATEMTTDVATVRIQSTGAKTTVMSLYPRKLVTVRSGTAQAGAATTITLDSGASAVDDYYNGMICVATLDSAVEVRVIGDYVGSTKVATIEGPNWNTTPDSDDTFVIKLPEGARVTQGDVVAFGGTAGTFASGRPEVNMTHIAGSSVSTSTAQLGVNVVNFGGSAGTFSSGRPEVNTTHAAGTAWGSGAITAASIASDAITAAKIATGAIDADAIADNAIDAGAIATGAITSAKFAAGAIDAAAIANGAIDAATFAADVDAEILSYIVDDATRIDASALNTLSGHDPGETIMGATDLGTGSGFTAIPWNSAWDAEVQSEVDDALVAQNLDHLVKSAVDTDFATTVHANSVIGYIADNGAGYDRTTDSLEAIRTQLDAVEDDTNSEMPMTLATIAGVVDAILTDTGTTLPGTLSTIEGKIDTVDGIVDDILVDTAEIGAAGAGLTNINLPNQTMDITGNITGNLSGSVGSVTALGNNSVTAAALAADAGAEIADAILNRDMSTGTDSGSTTVRTVRQALRFLRNKWSISGTTLTVTKEDDSTASWTTELTTSGSADPVVGSDPAGP